MSQPLAIPTNNGKRCKSINDLRRKYGYPPVEVPLLPVQRRLPTNPPTFAQFCALFLPIVFLLSCPVLLGIITLGVSGGVIGLAASGLAVWVLARTTTRSKGH